MYIVDLGLQNDVVWRLTYIEAHNWENAEFHRVISSLKNKLLRVVKRVQRGSSTQLSPNK